MRDANPKGTKKGKGKGKKGDRSRSPSQEVLDRRKKTICQNWARDGKCSFGDKCHFLHDSNAAPSTDGNKSDGDGDGKKKKGGKKKKKEGEEKG